MAMDAFVFDDEDLRGAGFTSVRLAQQVPGMLMQTVVPALRSSESIPPSWRLSMSTSFSPSVDGFLGLDARGSPDPVVAHGRA